MGRKGLGGASSPQGSLPLFLLQEVEWAIFTRKPLLPSTAGGLAQLHRPGI